MANVLQDLAADMYTAAEQVGRELTGTINGATINANGTEAAAVGQTIRSAVAPEAVENDVTASMTVPEGTDQNIGNKTATISKAKAVPIPWTGEDIRFVRNGAGYETIYGQQIQQAMRRLANLVEIDANVELAHNASRAVGTAGTNPFATEHDLINEGRQILVDNGCPTNDGLMSMVMNTSAGTKYRNLNTTYEADKAGTDSILRQGVLRDVSGIALRETGNAYSHTKGTGASFQLNGAVAAKGQTLTVDTGTGTILKGDIVTLNGDSNLYVVNSDLASGSFTIGETGLRQDAADNASVTVGNSYSSNFVFHQSALEVIMRPPAVPEGGDAAVDSMIVQDPRSRLVFEIRLYKGYRKQMIEVALAWGVKAWNSKYIATVLG